jgi:hypothetical protein
MTYTNTLPDSDSMLATMEAMRSQEETGYKTYDYLHQQEVPQCPPTNGPQNASLPTTSVDVDCRFRMSEWCYQIVDFCKFKRETVAFAMSCLDRFLCTPSGREVLLDRGMFQLAAMTALYTTIKVHEPEAMEPNLVASLSRGAFNRDQIEAMEFAMLSAIQWRVNPPTAIAFIHQYIYLIPDHLVCQEAREAVMDLAKFQTEVAVSDASLISVNASTVALASLINAFDSMSMDVTLQAHIQNVLSVAAKIDSGSSLFRDVRIRLYEAMTGPTESHLCSNLTPEPSCAGEYRKATSSVHGSPRSVSAAAI